MTKNKWDPLCAGCPDRWDTPLSVYDCTKCHELLSKEKPIVLPFCPMLNIFDSPLMPNGKDCQGFVSCAIAKRDE